MLGTTFKFKEVTDNGLVLFDRLCPSMCELCKRIHEHENCFAFIKNNNVYFNCRRSDNGSLDIGSLIPKEKEIYKRDLGLKMETLINVKFKYKGKILMIRPFMPTPTIPTKPICKIDQRANSSHSGNN